MALLGFLCSLSGSCNRGDQPKTTSPAAVETKNPEDIAGVVPLMQEHIRYRFAVCYPSRPELDPLEKLDEILAASAIPVARVEAVNGSETSVTVSASLRTHTPQLPSADGPARADLEKSLSPSDIERIGAINAACLLEWSYPRSEIWTGLRAAVGVTQQVAAAMQGIIWDDATGQVFSVAIWDQRRNQDWNENVPDINRHIVIQATTTDDGFLTAQTRGMTKFGLPEVSVDRYPRFFARSIGNTIVVFNQAMAEGLITRSLSEFDLDMRAIRHPGVRDPQVTNLESGGTAVLRLALRYSRPESAERLLELSFERGTGPDPMTRQTDILTRAFGSRDSTVKVRHDGEVAAASARARARLPELRKEFNAGLPAGELLLLKSPFKTPAGDNEYMWVEVTAWNEERIVGALMNEPASVPDLRAGQVVEVSELEVFDYIRHHADGSNEGNETAKLLELLGKESQD